MIESRRECGFSLMELMIALAVVAILATLAYPSFSAQLDRARRMDAITALLDLRLAQEGWRANHTGYADLDELGWPDASPEGHYRLHIAERSGAGFLALAEPRAGGPQQSDTCGTFALDQRGPLFIEGYADAACWRH